MTKPWDESGPFLDDFGETATSGNTQFQAILDAPQELVDVETGQSIVSDEWELRYATSAVTLQRGSTVTIKSKTFTVRDWPRRLDNGVFSVAKLAEVTSNG